MASTGPATLTDADIDKLAPLSDADISAHDQSQPEHLSYWQELWQQSGVPGLVKGLKEHPAATVAHVLGSALSVLNPGLDPVPTRGGVSVTAPAQGMEAQDIADRGPAAIGAAATLGAIPVAARYGLPAAASATKAAASKVTDLATSPGVPEAVGLFSPRAANGLRLIARGKKAVDAFNQTRAADQQLSEAMGGHDPALLDDLSQGLNQGRKFADASASEQAALRTIADRMKNPAINSSTAPQAPRPRSHYGLPEEPPAPAPAPAPSPAGPPDEVLQAMNSSAQQGAAAAPGITPPQAPAPAPAPQPIGPPPELLEQMNANAAPATPATPAPAPTPRTNGRMSRAQAAENDAYTLKRRTKSAEEMAQFLTKDPQQTQGLIDFLTEQPEGLEGDQLHALQDQRWKGLKTLMKQDQLANVQATGGRVGQEDVMNLKNTSAPDPATRRIALRRAQEILQQQAAAARKTAPGGGMGAMKKFRTDYNPAQLTDEQIAALHQ